MTEPKKTRTKRPPYDSGDAGNWFRSSDDVRSGFISGNSFMMKPVRCSAIGGMAIFEGDIALGTIEEMERVASAVSDAESLPVSGVAITGSRFRWPNGVIPYVIDPGLSNPQRVLDAIAHWIKLTPLRFVEREVGNAAHANYVSFEQLNGCWSQVGMRGGKQAVSLGPSCSLGSAIHELGHVAGLWHEHSRGDRDQYIRILWENIQDGLEHNFDQHITDGDDIGAYDYGSIMHYPALAFSKNGQPTIVAKAGEAVGQRTALSPGDIAAIRVMYGDATTTAPGQSGKQFLGSIPPMDSRRWITKNWPAAWRVVWSFIPSPTGARVEWNVVTERQSDEFLKYYIEVRNLSSEQANIEVNFAVV